MLLDDWKPWMVLAYFALVALVTWLFYLNRDLSREQAARAAAQAERNAEQRASAISQRDGCYTSVDQVPDLLAVIDSVRTNAMNSVDAARAALAIEPDGPLAKVRLDSIRRGQASIAAANRFSERIRAQSRTVADCDDLARELGLKPRPRPPQGGSS